MSGNEMMFKEERKNSRCFMREKRCLIEKIMV